MALSGNPVGGDSLDIGTTEATVFTAANDTDLTGLALCNKTANNVNPTVFFQRNGGNKITRWGAGQRAIPPGETIEVIDSSREVLKAGDSVIVKSDTASSIDAWASGME